MGYPCGLPSSKEIQMLLLLNLHRRVSLPHNQELSKSVEERSKSAREPPESAQEQPKSANSRPSPLKSRPKAAQQPSQTALEPTKTATGTRPRAQTHEERPRAPKLYRMTLKVEVVPFQRSFFGTISHGFAAVSESTTRCFETAWPVAGPQLRFHIILLVA